MLEALLGEGWEDFVWEPEPIYFDVLLAYFSNPALQLRHVIQAPIKGFIGFLGIVFFGLVWEVKRGVEYNYNPGAVAIFNSLASETNFVISAIKVGKTTIRVRVNFAVILFQIRVLPVGLSLPFSGSLVPSSCLRSALTQMGTSFLTDPGVSGMEPATSQHLGSRTELLSIPTSTMILTTTLRTFSSQP